MFREYWFRKSTQFDGVGDAILHPANYQENDESSLHHVHNRVWRWRDACVPRIISHYIKHLILEDSHTAAGAWSKSFLLALKEDFGEESKLAKTRFLIFISMNTSSIWNNRSCVWRKRLRTIYNISCTNESIEGRGTIFTCKLIKDLLQATLAVTHSSSASCPYSQFPLQNTG
jgi:hypothetical protein